MSETAHYKINYVFFAVHLKKINDVKYIMCVGLIHYAYMANKPEDLCVITNRRRTEKLDLDSSQTSFVSD